MFPLALAEQLIKTFSMEGDLVLDPFCGSGQTLLAAKGCGRRYLGMERDERYVQDRPGAAGAVINPGSRITLILRSRQQEQTVNGRLTMHVDASTEAGGTLFVRARSCNLFVGIIQSAARLAEVRR